MRFLASRFEDGYVPGPGLSVAQTVFTYVVIPVALFSVIALAAWLTSAPKEEKKESSVSSIN